MPYIPFQNICPKIAEKETRVIHVVRKDNEFDLPIGDYAFLELFCDECDCRRVFLQVFKVAESVATIVYGWDKLSFYRKEFQGFDKDELKELKGPGLEPFQYQSSIAENVFKMFMAVLFSDKSYMKRIEHHYIQFKRALGK